MLLTEQSALNVCALIGIATDRPNLHFYQTIPHMFFFFFFLTFKLPTLSICISIFYLIILQMMLQINLIIYDNYPRTFEYYSFF